MGLCKCPLKKVTNLFCFEHRVNVCESCLVQGHSQCVVQTYLKWLQDSDYQPDCQLCQKPLTEAPTVRLLCLDLFHEQCLSQYAQSLPPTTAPAAYQCVACQNPLFPDVSNHSPIAEALRSSLAAQQWARPGLGLPIEKKPVYVEPVVPSTPVPSTPAPAPGPPIYASTPATYLDSHSAYASEASPDTPYVAAAVSRQSGPLAPVPPQCEHVREEEKPKYHKTEIPVGIVNPVTGTFERKPIIDTREEELRPSVAAFDCDEDKYRRRSIREWLTRWFRLHSSSKSRDDPLSATFRRWTVLLFLGAFVFLTVILMMTRVSTDHASNDPFIGLKEEGGVQINPK